MKNRTAEQYRWQTSEDAVAYEAMNTAKTWMRLYWTAAAVLTIAFLLGSAIDWRTNSQMHTLVELAATGTAAFVGVMSLIRFYGDKNNTYLLVGTGFIGTAFLDGYHAIVTSSFFSAYLPSGLPSLIPWSWVASRFFLSLCLFLSWIAWKSEQRSRQRIRESLIYSIASILTVVNFLFFAFVPLPRAYYPELFFHRPEEFVPAVLFALALYGYLSKGTWKTDWFERCMTLSLIVGLFSQTLFMSRSSILFDPMFDLAHGMKVISYVVVLAGLLANTYLTFRQSIEAATELEKVNRALEQEVAERKQAERSLAASQTQLLGIVEASPAGMVMVDSDGSIVLINKATEELFGYARNELLGQPIEILVPERHRPQHPQRRDQFFQQASARPMGAGINVNGQHKSGAEIPVDIALSPVNTDGAFFVLSTIIDLREQKRAEQKLLEMSRQAGMAEVATGVLHNVGNILNSVNVSATVIRDRLIKSPLASLERVSELIGQHESSFVDFVRDDSRGSRIPAFIQTVTAALQSERTDVNGEVDDLVKNVNHIKQIISTQQSMAKHSGLEQEISVTELVEDSISAIKSSLSKYSICIDQQIEETAPPIVVDKHRVLQILVNLIKNGKDSILEFGSECPLIEVAVTSNNGIVEFAVTDNGGGIAEDKLERIFQHGFTTKETGHGFGLHCSANAATGNGRQPARGE